MESDVSNDYGLAIRLRYEEVTHITNPTLHRFASDRWLQTRSLRASKFWKSVIDRCAEKRTVARAPTLDEFFTDNSQVLDAAKLRSPR